MWEKNRCAWPVDGLWQAGRHAAQFPLLIFANLSSATIILLNGLRRREFLAEPLPVPSFPGKVRSNTHPYRRLRRAAGMVSTPVLRPHCEGNQCRLCTATCSRAFIGPAKAAGRWGAAGRRKVFTPVPMVLLISPAGNRPVVLVDVVKVLPARRVQMAQTPPCGGPELSF